jgi:RES domain-containing protein
MAVEELGVAPCHLITVARVHADRVVPDPAREPQAANRGTGQAHADAELAAQVDRALGLLVPGITARRRRLVPLLEDEPDVDVLLQAADPQLLSVGADQCADRGQRTARGIRID